MRIRTPFTQLFSYHFVSPLIDIVSHAFPSDLMMANKQGKIQMYFYELLRLTQRLDNKKNNRLDSGRGVGLGADAHFPLSKMNGDELTHWVNVFPPFYNLRWPPYSAAIFDVVVIVRIVYSIAMLDLVLYRTLYSGEILLALNPLVAVDGWWPSKGSSTAIHRCPK